MKNTNDSVKKYVYGVGLIGEDDNGHFKTYHFDYRGSTVAITNESGAITDRFAYDAYGKQISHTGNSFIIFGYNGRDGVITDVNGLLYMRSRYYSPELKRFVNADVLHGNISNSPSLNRYSYVNGNPVSFVDPFGLEGEESWWSKVKSWASEHKGWSILIGLVAGSLVAPGAFAGVTTLAANTFAAATTVGSMAFAALPAAITTGGVTGGVIGGLVNLSNDKPFWEGALGGAVSGTIFSLGSMVSSSLMPINPLLSLGVEFGTINNTINSVYYSFISDGVSNIDESGPLSYYVENGHLNRWERLDYAKNLSQDSWYSSLAWHYYSEYSVHMYGWEVCKWTCEYEGKESVIYQIFNYIADHSDKTDFFGNEWYIELGVIIFGLLGF